MNFSSSLWCFSGLSRVLVEEGEVVWVAEVVAVAAMFLAILAVASLNLA